MKDIASHITDIVENSIRARASKLSIALSFTDGVFRFTVIDNGCGMSAESVCRIADPFFTTRTERRVGLGLPLLFQNAEQCGGSVVIRQSDSGGVVVEAAFPTGDLDCPPTGDLGETLMQIIIGNPRINITIAFSCDKRQYSLSSEDIIDAIGGDIHLGLPRIAVVVREMLRANISTVFCRKLDF